jgi:hypothetical protein
MLLRAVARGPNDVLPCFEVLYDCVSVCAQLARLALGLLILPAISRPPGADRADLVAQSAHLAGAGRSRIADHNS